MALTHIEAKSALSKASVPDPFLPVLYRLLAPYRGCGHGCVYCDGRAEKYFVEGDFAKDVAVRGNLLELLARDRDAGFCAREFGAIGLGSGVTDVYQPIERDLLLTRKSLETLSSFGEPVVLITKNDLVLRDFDLLERFPLVLVVVTVTTMDEELAAILEPNASTPSARLRVVAEAKARGFFTGITAMPLCPGLSDDERSFSALLDAACGAGADFVYPGGLTLRPGRQKEAFLSMLDANFPGKRAEYDRLYAENRQSGMPLSSEARSGARALDAAVRERGLAQLVPHRVYRNFLSVPDAAFVLLCHMQTLYKHRGVDTRPLSEATDRYASFLKDERAALRRKRIEANPLDPFPITRALTERMEGLRSILKNDRLSDLLEQALRKDAYFDYTSLSVVGADPAR